jgi:predicted ATP-dependent serine protease
MTREEDIWTCSECGQEQGRHDQWFEGKCEKCHEEEQMYTFVY